MPSNDYHFITTWHVPATCEQISEVTGDTTGLARWWPSVYPSGPVMIEAQVPASAAIVRRDEQPIPPDASSTRQAT